MLSQPAVSSQCTLSSVGLSLAPNRPLSAKGLPLGSQACTTTGITWPKVTACEPSPSPTLPNPEAPVEFSSPTCAESAWGPPTESQAPGLSQPFSIHDTSQRLPVICKAKNPSSKASPLKEKAWSAFANVNLAGRGRKGRESGEAQTLHSS